MFRRDHNVQQDGLIAHGRGSASVVLHCACAKQHENALFGVDRAKDAKLVFFRKNSTEAKIVSIKLQSDRREGKQRKQ